MPNGLKKEDSAALKGFAVLLLIFHHCYRMADRIEKYNVDLCGLTSEQIVTVAECCKICVAIFAFVSGYGLMYGYSSKAKKRDPQVVSQWIAGHVLSTMSGFWFTAVISYLIYYLMKFKDFAAWREAFGKNAFAVVVDILGISKLMKTDSLNGAWWYMSAAFAFIILLPFLEAVIGRFGSVFCIASIFLFPRMIKMKFPGGSRPYSFLMIFVIGMVCCRHNFFQKFHEWGQTKLQKTVKFLGVTALMCSGFFFYHKIDMKTFWEFQYAVVPFLVIIFCVEYLFRIVPLSAFLRYLGRHSMNIWLVHTFVRDWGGQYVFALHKFWLIPIGVMIISLGISYFLDFLRKITGYDKLIQLAQNKLKSHTAVQNG